MVHKKNIKEKELHHQVKVPLFKNERLNYNTRRSKMQIGDYFG